MVRLTGACTGNKWPTCSSRTSNRRRPAGPLYYQTWSVYGPAI